MTATATLTRFVAERPDGRLGDEVRSSAASALYDAEVALHAARQSGVDEWIRVAADRLHLAVERYLAAAERR